jgi:hypothetical protein
MNNEIKEIKKDIEKEIYDYGINKKVKKLYREETNRNDYFIENDSEELVLTDNYKKWLIQYKYKQDNKLRKVICANPSCKQKIIFRHKHKPDHCPFCHEKFYSKPPIEYKLFKLQEKYLKIRDNKILDEMYIILKLYAKKLMIIMAGGKFHFKKEILEIKSHDAACKIIEYYLEKPEFYITNSFGGYLNWPIRNVLYGDKKEEENSSLNCMIDNENELDEYLSTISESARLKMQVNFDENLIDNGNQIMKELSKLIFDINKKINKNYSKQSALLYLIGLKNKIKGMNDNFMNSYYLYAGLDTQKNIDNSLFLMYKILKNYA